MGAGGSQPDVVFMTLGTGVGGGIVAGEDELLTVWQVRRVSWAHHCDSTNRACTCGKKAVLKQ